MAYSRLNKSDGEIFNAADVTHMEDGIVQNESDINTKADQTAVDKNADAITQINEDLTEFTNGNGGMINAVISSGSVLDYFDANYTSQGMYFCISTTATTGGPQSSTAFAYIVIVHSATQETALGFRAGSNPHIYEIKKQSGTWGSWLRIDPGSTDFSALGGTVSDALAKINTSLTDLTSSITAIEQEIDAIKEQIGMNTTSWPEISTKSADDEEITMDDAEEILGEDNE